MKQGILNNKAYTLIELLMTIAILVVVLGIVSVNFRNYELRGELDLMMQKFSSDLRLVQSYSLGLIEFDHDSDPSTNNRPGGGWGIYIDTNAGNNQEYTIFADHWDGTTLDYPDHEYNIGASELSRVVDLGNVTVSSSTIGSSNASRMSIVFQPPKPMIWICDYVNSCSATTSALLEFEKNGNKKVIKLNSFGLIDIDR